MKTPIEQVDDFIEGLVEGDIESYVQEYKKGRGVIDSDVDDILAHLHEDMEAFMAEAVIDNKKHLAVGVLNQILDVRLKGIYKNNPNTVRMVAEHRDFYKSRAEAAEARVKDLEEKLKETYIAFDNMMARFEKMGIKDKEERPE